MEFEYEMKEKDELLKQYILITPVKNEEKNLPNLVKSITNQTIIPSLWVIIDDGSADDTPSIIKAALEKFDWIKNIKLDESERDLGLHLSFVIKTGFDFAIEYCMKKEIRCDYLGNVDGDMILEHTFFERLIAEFESDSLLGVASGGTQYIKDDRVISANVQENEPSGGDMLIRRKCFEECNGILLTYVWDSALKVKARLRGWKTRRFEKIIATETRDVMSVGGYWKWYLHHGQAAYVLNYNLFHMLIKTIMYLFKYPYYTGFAFFLGFLSSRLQGKEQIDDEEIKKYYGSTKLYIQKILYRG